MKHTINNAYVNPDSYTFRLFSFLHLYQKWGFTLLPFIIFAYPVTNYLYQRQQNAKLQQKLQSIEQNIEQKKRLLQSLKQTQKQNNQTDNQLTYFNKQIQELAQQYQAKIEHMQWQFENGKQVDLTFIVVSKNAFIIIEKLNEIAKFKVSEIYLSKLSHDKLVQINLRLTLTP